jgi:membrane protease YdiL (CAAX protease family)
VILLFALAYPLSGYRQQKLLINDSLKKTGNKIKWYGRTVLWSWIPTLVIILVVVMSGFKLRHIGLKPINLATSGMSNWVIYSVFLIYILYLSYNLYSIIILAISHESRTESIHQIPQRMRPMLPVTKKERQMWVFVSITAGITEEIQYRGYLFFAFSLLFPSIPLWGVLIISTLLFGIGHIYQGKSAVRPTLAGFMFGFMYIIFDSIVPIILVHIIQDLVVTRLIDE